LGDVIHSMPFLDVLKVIYPESRISWVISKNLKAILEGHQLIDELILFDKDRWQDMGNFWHTLAEVPQFIRQLKRQYFDMVIDLQGLLRSGLITHFARSAVKIGLDSAREGSRYFYHKRIKTDDKAHAVDRYLSVVFHLAEQLYMSDSVVSRPVQFPLPVDSDAALKVEKILPGQKKYLLVAPSTRWDTKTWPSAFFATVISHLNVETIIIGSAADKEIADKVGALSQRHVKFKRTRCPHQQGTGAFVQ
jgi:heptosyltransferase-1